MTVFGFSLFLMRRTIWRGTGRVFCRMSLSGDLSGVLLIIGVGLWGLWERQGGEGLVSWHHIKGTHNQYHLSLLVLTSITWLRSCVSGLSSVKFCSSPVLSGRKSHYGALCHFWVSARKSLCLQQLHKQFIIWGTGTLKNVWTHFHAQKLSGGYFFAKRRLCTCIRLDTKAARKEAFFPRATLGTTLVFVPQGHQQAHPLGLSLPSQGSGHECKGKQPVYHASNQLKVTN